MKITELLNAQPTRSDATPPPRRLDMASLDLFASQRRAKEGMTNASGAMPMLQRQFPYADLVTPPRDAAMVAHKTVAPTVSPVVSHWPSEETDKPQGVKPSASIRKQVGKPAADKPKRGNARKLPVSQAPVSALTALAHAAVAAVKLEDEDDEPPTGAVLSEPKKRRTKRTKPPPAAASRSNTSSPSAGSGRAAPMTNDQKRAKQRMLVKKSYYRKIDTLNTLRETVAQLETEYSAVVEASQHTPKASIKAEPPVSRHSISALVATDEGELLQSFQAMAVNIDRLRHENEALRAIAMEQSKARTRVGILAREEIQDQHKRVSQYGEILQQIPPKLRTSEEDAEIERALASPRTPPSGPSPTASPRDKKRGAGSSPSSSSSCPIQMTPLTEDECVEVARDAYAELARFRKGNDYITSGGEVFGWRDRRRLVGDHVQFALEKTFHHRTAEDLALRTWAVLSTERGMNRIYSSSLRATYYLVQRVTDHNIVFYRTMEREGQNVLVKSLILASLVQTETGYMVLFRSIDPGQRNVRNNASAVSLDGRPPARHEMWMDMFSWGIFEPDGPNQEHCTDFFGGFVPATVAANAAFWLMEVLLIAVRCESECVGALFILQQPDEAGKDHDASAGSCTESCSSDHDDVPMETM